MFPKTSFVMLLVSGVLLLIACFIHLYIDQPVNLLYLGLGLLFIIFSTAMLLFKKKPK